MPVDFPALHDTPLAELREQAKTLGIHATEEIRHLDLVFEVGRVQGDKEGQRYGRGCSKSWEKASASCDPRATISCRERTISTSPKAKSKV